MPQPFNNAVMTNVGAALLTKAQAGQCNIEFTKMAIGDGQYTAEEETVAALQERTKLKSQRNDYTVNKCEVYTEKSVRVTAAISNYDPASGESVIDEGYYINEIGLFAKEKDGDASTEVLYSIVTVAADEGDFMPAYNGYNPATITQEYYATVDNSAEVYVDVSGAYATMDEVTEITDNLQEQITTNAGLMYPVGSIYLSVNDISPETYYGGTWQKIEDCFLLAAGANHAAGETGGEEAVALTASQIPSHTHNLPSHTHSIPSLSGTAASAGAHTHPTYYVADNTIGGNARRLGNADAYDGNSSSTVSAGAHTHNVTTTASTTGSASGTSDATGDGATHNNMPPYLTVYMWQRIA